MKTLFAVTIPARTKPRRRSIAWPNCRRARTSPSPMPDRDAGPDGSVKARPVDEHHRRRALSGARCGAASWGDLLSPLIGAAVGAAAGAASGYATDNGISDEFMTAMGQKLPGGGATLFIMAADMTPERVADAIGSPAAQVVYTNMPDDVEARFKSRIGDTGSASLPPPVDIAPM